MLMYLCFDVSGTEKVLLTQPIEIIEPKSGHSFNNL